MLVGISLLRALYGSSTHHPYSQVDLTSTAVLGPGHTKRQRLTLVMAHINLYLCNPHQASASYPFSSINANVNADADADAQCGQGCTELVRISWPRTERIWNDP